MKTPLGLVIAGALLAISAMAAPPAVKIKDASFKDAEGHRVLREMVVVDATEQAWKAFMTDEGFTRWAVPQGHVTPGVGGSMEWAMSDTFTAGDANNVLNRIDFYLPYQEFAWHNERVPSGGPLDPAVFGKVHQMLSFEPVGKSQTRVTQTVVGFGDYAKFDALYQHLRGGNAAYLMMLANNFHETDAEAHAAMQ
jgi:hypothetical protein